MSKIDMRTTSIYDLDGEAIMLYECVGAVGVDVVGHKRAFAPQQAREIATNLNALADRVEGQETKGERAGD